MAWFGEGFSSLKGQISTIKEVLTGDDSAGGSAELKDAVQSMKNEDLEKKCAEKDKEIQRLKAENCALSKKLQHHPELKTSHSSPQVATLDNESVGGFFDESAWGEDIPLCADSFLGQDVLSIPLSPGKVISSASKENTNDEVSNLRKQLRKTHQEKVLMENQVTLLTERLAHAMHLNESINKGPSWQLSEYDDYTLQNDNKSVQTVKETARPAAKCNQIAELREANQRLIQENIQISSEVARMSRVVEDLESQVAVSQDENANLSTGLEELDIQHQQAIEQILIIKDETLKNYETLLQEHNVLKSKYDEEVSKILEMSLLGRTESCEVQTDYISSEIEDSLTKKLEMEETKTNSLQRELQKQYDTVEEIEVENKRLLKELKERNGIVQETVGENIILQSRLTELMAKETLVMESCEVQTDTVPSIIEENMRSRLETDKALINTLQRDVQDKNETVQVLEGKNLLLNNELTELKVKERKADTESCEVQTHDVLSEIEDSLRRKLETDDAHCQNLLKELQVRDEIVQVLEEDNLLLRNELTEKISKESIVASVSCEVQTDDVPSETEKTLRRKLISEEGKSQNLLSELQERDDELQTMEEENSQLRSRLTELIPEETDNLPPILENNEELELLEQKVMSLESVVTILREVRSNLEAELSTAKCEIEGLGCRLQASIATNRNQENLQAEVAKLADRETVMKDQLSEAENVNSVAKQTNQELQCCNLELKKEIEKYVSQLDQGREKTSLLLKELGAFKLTNTNLMTEVEGLNNVISLLQSNVKECDCMLSKTLQKCSQLEATMLEKECAIESLKTESESKDRKLCEMFLEKSAIEDEIKKQNEELKAFYEIFFVTNKKHDGHKTTNKVDKELHDKMEMQEKMILKLTENLKLIYELPAEQSKTNSNLETDISQSVIKVNCGNALLKKMCGCCDEQLQALDVLLRDCDVLIFNTNFYKLLTGNDQTSVLNNELGIKLQGVDTSHDFTSLEIENSENKSALDKGLILENCKTERKTLDRLKVESNKIKGNLEVLLTGMNEDDFVYLVKQNLNRVEIMLHFLLEKLTKLLSRVEDTLNTRINDHVVSVCGDEWAWIKKIITSFETNLYSWSQMCAVLQDSMKAERTAQNDIFKQNEPECTGNNQVTNLQTERDQLINSLQLKHAESVKYHSEIQRLNQLLSAEFNKSQMMIQEMATQTNHAIQMQRQLELKDAMLSQVEASSDRELSALRQEIETLQNQLEYASQLLRVADRQEAEGQPDTPLTQGICSEECALIREQLQKLEEEKAQVVSTLQENQLKHMHLQNEVRGNEERLMKEVKRLQEHLVSVEESYTEELVKANEANTELQQRLAQADHRVKSSSTAYTSASIRANQQVESLQGQVRLLSEQKERLQEQLSGAEDQLAKQAAALTNLQAVLDQFMQEKDKTVAVETERIQRTLDQSYSKNADLIGEIQSLQAQLKEASEGLSAASRLSEQLDKKSDMINALRQQVSELQEHVKKEEENLEAAKTSVDAKVDRCLVKNLVVGYVCAPANNRLQVLRVLASVLDLKQEERQKIGLDPSSGPYEQSLSEAFIHFLEKESQPQPHLRLPMVSIASLKEPRSRKTSSLLLSDVMPNPPQFPVGRATGSILKDVLKDNRLH